VVAELTLDDPPTRNALGVEALTALRDELSAIGDDPTVRVVVLRATGMVFSSGANRADLADADAVAASTQLLGELVERIATLRQPVLCRVNGDAYGAGLALIAATDLSVAVRRARFALPEPRFGFVATVAAATCARRVGLSVGLDLFLTGRRVGADEAAAAGLVTLVVDDEAALDDVVSTRINELMRGAPDALAATKQIVRELCSSSPGADLELATRIAGRAGTDEQVEGIAATVERRDPAWVQPGKYEAGGVGLAGVNA